MILTLQIIYLGKEHGKESSAKGSPEALCYKGIVWVDNSMHCYSSRHHDDQKHSEPGQEVMLDLKIINHKILVVLLLYNVQRI